MTYYLSNNSAVDQYFKIDIGEKWHRVKKVVSSFV